MIRFIRENGGYKYYAIDLREVWLSEDRRESFIQQLDIILTEQDAREGYKLVQVIPFQDEYIVVLTIR